MVKKKIGKEGRKEKRKKRGVRDEREKKGKRNIYYILSRHPKVLKALEKHKVIKLERKSNI